MNITRLFTLQKQLDDRILEEHRLKREDLFSSKILALEVEIGELANETRCFKYWSQKPPSSNSVILEEYVDGLHFILSLGIDGGWQRDTIEAGEPASTLTENFHKVFEAIFSLRQEPKKESFVTLLVVYLGLGKALGFSPEEVKEAYLEKNQKNHERQDEGY
ncbi:dUTP diphosphatase [Thalassorhabdus alkalitolerans]|uniref:dUTP diphosphatase n=1 Tax=Thalassorhabdus alkalitolerans TaxID=2282697 RepID=A0ABW0YMS4_9BACI